MVLRSIIAPVDGSPDSWRGVQTALSLGARTSSRVRVLHVEFGTVDRALVLDRRGRKVARFDTAGVETDLEVRIGVDSVHDEIEAVVRTHPGALVVMASHGRGRSTALVGSVAEEVQRRTIGPILLVGPRVRSTDFDGPIVVTVDGSETSERAVPLGVSWAIDLGLDVVIVHSTGTPSSPSPATSRPSTESEACDTARSTYIADLARRIRHLHARPIECQEIHGRHPATAVADHAERSGAAMLVASSHGRTGFARLTMGSVVSGFVRHAPCPVLVLRALHDRPVVPPHPLTAHVL